MSPIWLGFPHHLWDGATITKKGEEDGGGRALVGCPGLVGLFFSGWVLVNPPLAGLAGQLGLTSFMAVLDRGGQRGCETVKVKATTVSKAKLSQRSQICSQVGKESAYGIGEQSVENTAVIKG